jgi:hypothetical protein
MNILCLGLMIQSTPRLLRAPALAAIMAMLAPIAFAGLPSSAAKPAFDPASAEEVGADGLTDRERTFRQTIAQCVAQVRSQAPSTRLREYWLTFDAYYSGSGRVQSNGVIRGRMDAQFAFNKCLADSGYYPLKPSAQQTP